MKNISLAFGKRIRNLRMSENISQERLAELSGLHPTYIGQIERAEKSPTLESICKIAQGLDMTVGKLFYNIEGISEPEANDYAIKVYNEILSLPDDKKEKLYHIVCDILNL